jgi:Domain of unknown function (DUF4845)
MKTLKALVGVLVVVSIFWVGYKIVPVYFNYYQFQDAIEAEARLQSYSTKTEGDIRETVWKKAQEYELPLTSSEQIKVERTGNSVAISTEYTVHVDVPIYSFDLNFKPNSKNKQI